MNDHQTRSHGCHQLEEHLRPPRVKTIRSKHWDAASLYPVARKQTVAGRGKVDHWHLDGRAAELSVLWRHLIPLATVIGLGRTTTSCRLSPRCLTRARYFRRTSYHLPLR